MCRDLLEAGCIRLPRIGGARPAVFAALHCAVNFEQFEGFLHRVAAGVQFRADVVERQCVPLFERAEHALHHFQRRERGANEIILNFVILASAQQNAKGGVHRAARAPDLLIIRHHRTGPLEVNYEADIRFVETHSERNGGN